MLNRLASRVPIMGLLALSLMKLGTVTSAGVFERTRSANSAADPYKVTEVEGWTVHVKRDFLDLQPALAERTLTLLRLQLFQIARIVPARRGQETADRPDLGRGKGPEHALHGIPPERRVASPARYKPGDGWKHRARQRPQFSQLDAGTALDGSA